MVRGNDDAGRESLDVPFPGSGQRFVEIVDVEKDVALRRGEAAKVHKVSVAAGLHAKSGPWGRRQISRHDRGRATVEGEGRLGHASEGDRDQRRDPAFVGLAQKFDRIPPILGRLPTAMRGARRRIAQRLPGRAPLVRRYVRAGAPEASLVGSCFVFVLRMPTLPSRPCVFQRDLIDTTPPTREIRAYCVASSLVAARAFSTRWCSQPGSASTMRLTRVEVVDGSRWTGALLDPARNAQSEGLISVEDSSVAVWVIPTDEERLIARHTAAMLQ